MEKLTNAYVVHVRSRIIYAMTQGKHNNILKGPAKKVTKRKPIGERLVLSSE